MGDIIHRNQPCLDQVECGSSDARQVYADLTSFCFSCKKFFPKHDGEVFIEKGPEIHVSKKTELEEVKEYTSRGFKDRHIEKHICEFFGVKVRYNSEGNIDAHYYPYDGGKSYKERVLPKQFFWVGPASKNLFGQSLFSGGGRRLIITEGEIDALSVAQASHEKYGKIYPVVSVSSASGTKAILENRDWIRSFQEVVVWFDNDKAGEEALTHAIRYIGADKVKIAKAQEKDASDVLTHHGYQKLLQVVFDAAKYVPSGIISKEALWEALVNYNKIPSLPYPPCLEGINGKLKGKRLGEIALFISGTGSGKSTMLREDMIYTLEHIPKEDKIGVISLEESPPETARKLAGMVLNKNPADEEIPIEELKEGFDKLFGDDRIILLDHQGSMNDDSIIDKLEYMCLSGCKYIYIDHITILVSEGAGDLTGNEAQDKIMNDLLRLVKRYPVWIGLVSHLRKTPNTAKAFEEGKLPSLDDIRGSGSIKQVSFDVIAFARNMTAEDDKVRNTIKIRVLKSRQTGLTGDVRGAYYDFKTGRLSAGDDFVKEEFVTI
jgi:twinkle protein